MDSYMKKPCKHCPFKISQTPFLHPDRAFDIASSVADTYASFYCHKTLEDGEEDTYVGEGSKLCAGWLSMKARDTSDGIPKDFEPDLEGTYQDSEDMYDAYKKQWDKDREITN